MHLVAVFAVGVAAFAGVAAAAPAERVEVATEVIPLTGFRLEPPGVTRDGESLRFRGFLCRKSVAMSPYRVRLERLSSDGQVLGAATGRVSGLSGRGHRCTVYTVTAPWRLEPGDRVRACAQRGDGPCPAGG